MAAEQQHPGRYRLLVLDVDGTLLTSRATISVTTRAAIQRARASGLLVTLATGRRLSTVQPQLDALDLALPVILQSGAQIVQPRSHEVLYSNPLPRAHAAAAVRIAVGEGVQPILYENRAVDQHLLTGPAIYDSVSMRPYVAARPDLVRRLPYDRLLPDDAPLQLAVIDSLPMVRRVAARLRLAHCRTLISYSAALDGYFLEVFDASCSKGAALRYLVDGLGLSMQDVVAVGDNYNDREMIEMAGLGVAMANAEPEIRASADIIVPSNDEDGIAVLVDQWLVGNEA